jgi:sigma-E factor negative regulatory protein RseA
MEILMDTNKKNREHISALKDGELSASDLELAFAALQSADGHQAWEVYHRIGDVLRSQASPDLSPGFAARLQARLAAEPAHGKREAAHAGQAGTAGAAEAAATPAVQAASRPASAP